MSVLRSEQMAEAFRARYVRGRIDLDEMERGVERALRGECTDDDYVVMAQEEALERLRGPFVGPVMPRWWLDERDYVFQEDGPR